jgi:hypothetical protein
MRALLVLLAVALVGCGAPSSGSAPPGPSGTASDEAGPFRLRFAVVSTTVRQDEPILGQSQLELMVGQQAALSGSAGGPLSFEFVEVTGDRRMIPVWDAACAPHEVRAAAPLVSEITKSGGWSDDEPNGAFYREFFMSPDVLLPPGEWDITAIASFVAGRDCTGPSHELRATIRVRVIG